MRIIRLPDERYEEIKRVAVDTLVRCEVECVPVNGFEVASKLGVSVVPYPVVDGAKRNILMKRSPDGFCVEMAEGWVIRYNDRVGYGRLNNTLLHEIGHIVLDHTELSDLAEAEVKFFAKYILAPPILVHRLGLHSPSEIANRFRVSHEAACLAWGYYQTWLRLPRQEFTPYEVALLGLYRVKRWCEFGRAHTTDARLAIRATV